MCSHGYRLKEQQLKDVKDNALVLDKGRETAERATDSAQQAKQRMESDLKRLQQLVTELEQSKRQASASYTAAYLSQALMAYAIIHRKHSSCHALLWRCNHSTNSCIDNARIQWSMNSSRCICVS